MRAGDLRFTLAEAGRLLNQDLRLDLTDWTCRRWKIAPKDGSLGCTWPPSRCRTLRDRHGFVQAFAGSDRFVLDYLMEEVLAQQPPDLSSFLLQTSLLDRFSAVAVRSR